MFRIDREKNIEICEGISRWGYKWRIDKHFGDTEFFYIVQNDIDKEIISVNTAIAGRGGCHMIMTSYDILGITSKLLSKLKTLIDDNPETKTKEVEYVIENAEWVIGVINNSFGSN
ncbi:hypothetical protein WOB53_02810 [Providencia rettgeri]|uniref:hypothetical protein n=1 Tax=Providencia TaxID=586 RepID=UPI00234A1159|nr:hypothetical protein [Providencia sp. PROV273]